MADPTSSLRDQVSKAGGAILFDLDGTLVDTVGTRIDAWSRALREAGLLFERGQLARLIGSDGRYLAREIARRTGMTLDDDAAEELDRRSGALYDELNIDPRPLPGVRELLEAIDRRAIPWAIATSSRKEQVTGSVRALGLTRPPTIVDGSDIAHAKPAPDLLLRAAQVLGVDPAGCWYIGDSIWDMRAGVAAGMTTIAVTAGAAVDAATLVEAGASVVLATASDLIARLPA
jgi:HAD superfamily hydrolase (TIGR01509 family)